MKRFFYAVMTFFSVFPLLGFVLNEKQAVDETFFENFKRDPFVGSFFEPVSIKHGSHYLKEIKIYHNELLMQIDRFRENDLYGNPRKGKYTSLGYLSPTTLRFIKIAGNIGDYFGSLENYRILHLGAGYGGLCKILAETGGWASYTIAQEKGSNLLCKKYLDLLGLDNIEYLTADELEDLSRFDFLIVDSEFLTESIDLTPILKVVPRGILLKRGIPEQLYSSIKTLKAAGFKGKLQGDLNEDENVLHLLFWKPDQEYLSSSFDSERLFIEPSAQKQDGVAVTNQVTTHRLGDQLLTYFTAKWFSQIQCIPFLQTPFPYADQFQLSVMDYQLGKGYKFKNIKYLTSVNWKDLLEPSTLWQFPFLPYSRQEMKNFKHGKNLVKVDWDNPQFRTLIRESLTPLHPISTIIPPKERLSVALHVRRGGSFKEEKNMLNGLPLKFASDAFMIRALKSTIALFPNTPFYIYLFTDDLNPEKIIETYSVALGSADIQWDFGKNASIGVDQAMLSDLLSFQNFDCLIRPCSHFSIMGGKLGRYLLEIGPTHYYLNENKEPIYDQIELFFRPFLTSEDE